MVQTPDVSPKPQKEWWRDFFKPVNAVSVGLGLIGLLLAVYFYRVSEVRPAMSWTVSKQIVFDHHSTTPAITVSDANGSKIESDIYAAQIIVWNSGNQRLDNVDASSIIRIPLTFRLNGMGRILTASITASQHNESGDWRLEWSHDVATLEWKHFDPGAGARVLVLYTGDATTNVVPRILIAGHADEADFADKPGLLGWIATAFFVLAFISGQALRAAQGNSMAIYRGFKVFSGLAILTTCIAVINWLLTPSVSPPVF